VASDRRKGVAAVVLAGGRGERLGGRSKALLPLGPGGMPLVRATVELLETVASPVLVSARDTAELAFLGRTLVIDRETGLGPLAGIASALEASPEERCLVVACDMPFLSRALLEHLIELSRDHDEALSVVPETSQGLHPLHAVWKRSLLPEVRARLARRALALHELIEAVPSLRVAEDELRRYDPALVSLENVNTPADLERATERRRRLDQGGEA